MNKPKFTRHCICGEELQAAYHPDLDIVFWNCFNCFPIHKKANKAQKKQLQNHKNTIYKIA